MNNSAIREELLDDIQVLLSYLHHLYADVYYVIDIYDFGFSYGARFAVLSAAQPWM